MREMPARCQIEPHERVARLHERKEYGLVCLRTGMGLHVGEVAVEKPLCAIDGQFFGNVHIFAAAVVPPARIAFRVLVREYRTLRFQYGLTYDVFRRNKLDLLALARR